MYPIPQPYGKSEEKQKTALELRIEKLGYSSKCYRQYFKPLEYDERIDQIIRLDFVEDKLNDCFVEAHFNIKKQDVSNINIAINRVNDDFAKLLKEVDE